MQFTYDQFSLFNNLDPLLVLLLCLLAVWSLIWKGIALWKAAQNHHKGWFVMLLLLNTVGILDIVYVFYFSKPKAQQTV